MRVMALDIGEKRIGVAVSDPVGRVATPVCVLPAADVTAASATWRRTLEDWDPDLLLCGLPLTLSGKEGPQAARIRDVAAKIAAAADLPLAFADERLSSASAKRIMRENGATERDMRGKLDMIAASMFLQMWLDANAQASASAQVSATAGESEPCAGDMKEKGVQT